MWPGAISRSLGFSSAQRGMACGQRGWKWQPEGGFNGDGISPYTPWKMRLRPVMRGTSLSSAWV